MNLAEVFSDAIPEILAGIAVAVILGAVGILYRHISRKPQNQVTSKAQPQVSKEKSSVSHLLIERGPQFSEMLRDQLLSYKQELKILSDFFEDNKEPFENYKVGLQRFLDDPDARWLVTVYPEEDRCRFRPDEEQKIISTLAEKGKHMVCFESGYRFVGRTPFVAVIETDHETATRDLLLHLATEQLLGQTKVHFVTLSGPQSHSIVNKRRYLLSEFLARVVTLQNNPTAPTFQYNNNSKEFWDYVLRFVQMTDLIRLSSLPCNTWSRQVATEVVSKYINSLDISSEEIHTCFICVNDEVALGAKDAIESYIQKGMEEINVSIYGFDGILEMTKCLDAGMRGGTMRIQTDLMCNQLKNIKQRNLQSQNMLHFQIPAIKKTTNFQAS